MHNFTRVHYIYFSYSHFLLLSIVVDGFRYIGNSAIGKEVEIGD